MRTLSFLIMVLLMASCSDSPKNITEPGPASVIPAASDVTPEQWQALQGRAVYFGHQSVGQNIIEGIRELSAKNSAVKINIASGPAHDASPELHEFMIGENGDPPSKILGFSKIMAASNPPRNAILMFKFCFVDMEQNTNVQNLFQQYRDAVNELRAQYPCRTIVHITMPLTVPESTLRYVKLRVLGRDTEHSLNVKRNQYDNLMRAEYGGKDPIFDLAEIESTRADGSRSFYMVDGARIYSLAPEWSSDGGHLNEAGREHVAGPFLATLASLPNGN
jgi:hypothetical protein